MLVVGKAYRDQSRPKISARRTCRLSTSFYVNKCNIAQRRPPPLWVHPSRRVSRFHGHCVTTGIRRHIRAAFYRALEGPGGTDGGSNGQTNDRADGWAGSGSGGSDGGSGVAVIAGTSEQNEKKRARVNASSTFIARCVALSSPPFYFYSAKQKRTAMIDQFYLPRAEL